MLPALVLTAGLGTRLDPITRIVAKPAVPLGDSTLIEHVLAWLRGHGVRDVVLNLHHLPQTITALVGDGTHLGLSVRYSWEQPVLGSAGGPRHALPLIAADDVVIVNGDTLCDLDLASLIDAHRQGGAEVTLAVLPNPAPDRYNGIAATSDGVVTGFVPKGHSDRTWHFVGVQVVRSRAFDRLQDGVPAETVAGFYRDLVRETPGSIRIWKTSASFVDVGTPRDYLSTALGYSSRSDTRPQEIRAVEGQPFRVADADRPHAGRASISGSIVWPRVALGRGVVLDDCVVVGPLRLPDDFQARSAVIAPAGIARPGDDVTVRDGLAVFPIR